VVACLAVWLIVPEALTGDTAAVTWRRLSRLHTDMKVAGVRGELADYFEVDSTPICLLWVVLAICPGAIIGGVIAYVVAWLVLPVSSLRPRRHPAADRASGNARVGRGRSRIIRTSTRGESESTRSLERGTTCVFRT